MDRRPAGLCCCCYWDTFQSTDTNDDNRVMMLMRMLMILVVVNDTSIYIPVPGTNMGMLRRSSYFEYESKVSESDGGAEYGGRGWNARRVVDRVTSNNCC